MTLSKLALECIFLIINTAKYIVYIFLDSTAPLVGYNSSESKCSLNMLNRILIFLPWPLETNIWHKIPNIFVERQNNGR